MFYSKATKKSFVRKHNIAHSKIWAMNLLTQCKFYGVKLVDIANETGFTSEYVRMVLSNHRRNTDIQQVTLTALHNRKEELLTELLKESA